MVAAGCTVFPPTERIILRSYYSMGPVKYRYIHYEKSGDQYVGREINGVSVLTK